jgi:hypothetical protein
MSTIALAAAAGSNIDWSKFIGIPAGIIAVITIATMLVGVIHPTAVQAPIYWHDGGTTRAKLTVKNRLFAFDCKVNAIVIYTPPDNFFKRRYTRKWRQQASSVPCIPFGLTLNSDPVTISKRSTHDFTFELRPQPDKSANITLDDKVRIEATSGRRNSLGKKLTFRSLG